MSLLDRLKTGLIKTSRQIGAVFSSFTGLNDDFYDSLEETLILADVGVQAASAIVGTLRQAVISEGLRSQEEIRSALAVIIEDKLKINNELNTDADSIDAVKIILVIGVNGVGKTTTIGKLSARYKNLGKSVLLCAGDTFRAAASEQLAIWAGRTSADIIRREEGADPASVVFDALSAAGSRGSDVIICDTAGRLHNKTNLMNELAKISRIIDREMPQAHKETLLVLDATTGQNGLEQAKQFAGISDITGIVLTKLDGTAKGGIVLAVSQELGIPVKYIGIGEKTEDLVDFDAHEFAQALLM